MNIFSYAMQMEAESQDYYRSLANQTDDLGLKTIFNMLADEEAKHYKIIEEMKTKARGKVGDSNLLSNAKAVFQKMVENQRFNFTMNQLELYSKAQDIEAKSKSFYLEKADEVEDDVQKEIFRKLANEEDKHYFLLQNIIDFVSRPKNWLENAEWYHLEEY